MSKYILPSLQENSKTYEEMLVSQNTDIQNKSEHLSFQREIMNLENLANNIASNKKSIGEGQFGKVFDFDYNLDLNGENKIRMAAKEIQVPYNIKNIIKNGDMQNFDLEIKMNLELGSMDPNSLYYPNYYGTFDVTDYFLSLIHI